MKELYKNPHTFDMNDYYTGLTFVIGGRDFEREDKDIQKKENVFNTEKMSPKELDWSFLKSMSPKARRFK